MIDLEKLKAKLHAECPELFPNGAEPAPAPTDDPPPELADRHADMSASMMRYLEIEPETPQRELPKIDNATSLLAESLELPPQVIHGLLHQGLKGVLGSSSKARKTWILLDAAISVASGRPFWNWATVRGRVLYINFEIPRAFIRSRIKCLSEAKGVTDLSLIDCWTLRGFAGVLGRLVPRLLERIAKTNYLLVIIDPIYKGLGGRDENSAGDIGELCNELEQVAVQTGAAVLYAAHFSKGNQAGKDAIDRIGGSGVWTRDADSIITLTRHEEEDAYTVDTILRNLPESPPFVVRWQFPLMTIDQELNPESLKQISTGRPRQHDPDDLLDLLPDSGISDKEWQKSAREEHEISRATYFRLKNELKERGLIMFSVIDDVWKRIIVNKK